MKFLEAHHPDYRPDEFCFHVNGICLMTVQKKGTIRHGLSKKSKELNIGMVELTDAEGWMYTEVPRQEAIEAMQEIIDWLKQA